MKKEILKYIESEHTVAHKKLVELCSDRIELEIDLLDVTEKVGENLALIHDLECQIDKIYQQEQNLLDRQEDLENLLDWVEHGNVKKYKKLIKRIRKLGHADLAHWLKNWTWKVPSFSAYSYTSIDKVWLATLDGPFSYAEICEVIDKLKD